MHEKYLILNHNNVILFLIGIFTVAKCDEITTVLPEAINAKECNILPKIWFAINESYQETNGVVFKDDIENGCIMSENYPEPYTSKSSHKYVITVDEGYQIDIFIAAVDLDSGAGDYLSIKSGESGEEVIFTWLHKNSKHFITSKNIAILDFVVQERSDPNVPITHNGFYLEWEKTGELITTTETPTTMPTYPNDEIETFTVYITGSSTPEEFVQKKITLFRELLVKSSNQYCKDENIPIEDEITIKNVNITSVSYCPLQWPNYQDCTKIIFAIPVFLETDTDTNQTYELSEEHLKEMWNQHHVSILEKLDMEEFSPPNSSAHVIIWVGVSLIIAGLFAVFLVVLWRYEYFYTPSSIRRLSESGSVYGDKPRISDISLYPTEHQVIPPMFESLGEPLQGESVTDFSNRNSFPYYEPEDELFSVISKKGSKVAFYTPSDNFGSFPRGYQA